MLIEGFLVESRCTNYKNQDSYQPYSTHEETEAGEIWEPVPNCLGSESLDQAI